MRDAGQRQLQAFLADFLCDPPSASARKLGGIAAGGRTAIRLRDDLFEPAQKHASCCAADWGVLCPNRWVLPSWQAGLRVRPKSASVSVAIGGDFRGLEKMTESLALVLGVPAAAPKGDAAARLVAASASRFMYPKHEQPHRCRCP